MRFKIPADIDFLAVNHASWDKLAQLHYDDPNDWYDIKGFLAGKDARCVIDQREMGDLGGARVLHSQCHFGLDTLSVARQADHAVGLDFSEHAVANARKLAERAGLADRASFVHANVYDAGTVLEAESFDIIYASWGVTGWLPDLQGWASTLCALLKPGGRFYYAEGHPYAWTLEEPSRGDTEGALTNQMSYWHENAIIEEWPVSYTGVNIPDGTRKAVEFAHTLEDFFAVFLHEGMTVDFFREHEGIPWAMYSRMARNPEDELFYLPAGHHRLPMGFSMQWTKPIAP